MDFLEEYKRAFVVTGTVSFPSSFPASAQVYIIDPDMRGESHSVYIKIVQILNEKQFKTWLIQRKDIRAVRIPAPNDTKSGPYAGWELRTGAKLDADIQKACDDHKGTYCIRLYPTAIVLVPDSAPVITRYEFATPAAECGAYPEPAPCNPCNWPNC
jgi:hypothetical protein